MNEPIPKLEPLVDNLKEFNIGEFLKSRDFKRYCIKAGLDDYWRDTYNHVKKTRNFVSLGMDHEKYDSEDTLNLVMNDLYENYHNQFFNFIRDFLYTFSQWNKTPISTSELIEDLELLNCPKDTLEFIENLDNHKKIAVPKSEIPSIVDNAKKLKNCIDKMDKSIEDSEFNLTLTYAYSSLEGIFKAYIEKNVPSKKDESDLSKISKIVKEDLKRHFLENEKKFPDPMLNLIGTITNAISNARNNFSESHFDKISDKWLAEFTRDCVNSIGRLIIKFIK